MTIKFRVDEESNEFTLKVGSPVRSLWEAVPDWFKGAAQRVNPDPDKWSGLQDDGEVATDIVFASRGRGWFDHAGWSEEGEKSKLVVEPYALELDDVEDLIAFCEEHDFEFEILGKSRHYPSSTVRISIFPQIVHPFRKYETPQDHIAHVKAFQMNNRLVAADILEHFLYLVPTDKQKFFQNAIQAVRHFGNGDTDYRQVVERFHQTAERRHVGEDDLLYRFMLSALICLTQPEEPLREIESFILVRVNCQDAAEYKELGGDRRGEAREWVEQKLEAARDSVLK